MGKSREIKMRRSKFEFWTTGATYSEVVITTQVTMAVNDAVKTIQEVVTSHNKGHHSRSCGFTISYRDSILNHAAQVQPKTMLSRKLASFQ